MEKGISLYPGLGMTREELVGRVEQAAQKGMTRLFLSFHITETNEAAFQKDIDALFEAARCYDLNVVGDLGSAGTSFLDQLKVQVQFAFHISPFLYRGLI